MRTRNVSLTEALDQAVQKRVDSGAYENASEVVRAALRALDQVEQEDAEKLIWLRKAIRDGLDSGVYKGDPFEDVRGRLKLPPLPRAKRRRG